MIAHRGLPRNAQENTLQAFARARDAGADGVELDVRLAADGVPVVVHDADLERVAGERARIDALTCAQLAAIPLAKGGSIPSLSAALEATRDMAVNVEIKSPREERATIRSAAADALVDAVIRAVDAAPGDRVLISSFDPFALARVRLRRPRWFSALLFHPDQRLWLRRAGPAALIRPWALHPHHELATPAAIARWRRRGFRVHPFTVDDPQRARELAAAGAAALITDEPERLGDALRRRSDSRCRGR